MWDIVVLTAGNVKQKADFELYLKSLDLSQYAGEVTVIADDLEGVKIGSGGSTVHVIWNLYKKYGGNLVAKRILLIHSGGLSTRMPHISARGKIFTQLPGSKTMLEAKLASYRELSTAIRAGVVITASDVIEDVRKFKDHPKDCDFLLFGHESDIEIAKNHGVYVMDPRGHLRTVLQKPDEDALQTYFGQHLPQKFLTDSFYWISWDIALKLKDLARKNMNFEVCCYGDFMFCLGTCPNEDYIFEGTNQARRTLRQIICNVLKGSAAKVVNMGEDSFFHFGTATEFLDHIDKNSIFYQKFLGTLIENRFANSSIQNLTMTPGSRVFIENCQLMDVEVTGDCIISGVTTTEKLVLDNTLLFTMDLINQKFVTFAFGIKDNLKAAQPNLKWFGKDIGQTKPDMWNESLFPASEDREESLKATVSLMNQPGKSLCRIGMEFSMSIGSAVAMNNTQATIDRNQRVSL